MIRLLPILLRLHDSYYQHHFMPDAIFSRRATGRQRAYHTRLYAEEKASSRHDDDDAHARQQICAGAPECSAGDFRRW